MSVSRFWSRNHRSLALGCAALLLSISTSVSAPMAPAPRPKPNSAASTPQVTTASYQNWVLRCVQAIGPDKSDPANARQCEIIQTIEIQGRKQPIAQVAIGQNKDDEKLILTAVLPVNVLLPGAVQILLNKDTKETEAIKLAWARCMQSGCFASASISTDALSAAEPEEQGLLQFLAANGQAISVPLSWHGLAQATKALQQTN